MGEKPNVSKLKTEPLDSTKSWDHVTPVLMKVVQKWRNQISHLVANQPEVSQISQTSQLEISQLETNRKLPMAQSLATRANGQNALNQLQLKTVSLNVKKINAPSNVPRDLWSTVKLRPSVKNTTMRLMHSMSNLVHVQLAQLMAVKSQPNRPNQMVVSPINQTNRTNQTNQTNQISLW